MVLCVTHTETNKLDVFLTSVGAILVRALHIGYNPEFNCQQFLIYSIRSIEVTSELKK